MSRLCIRAWSFRGLVRVQLYSPCRTVTLTFGRLTAAHPLKVREPNQPPQDAHNRACRTQFWGGVDGVQSEPSAPYIHMYHTICCWFPYLGYLVGVRIKIRNQILQGLYHGPPNLGILSYIL